MGFRGSVVFLLQDSIYTLFWPCQMLKQSFCKISSLVKHKFNWQKELENPSILCLLDRQADRTGPPSCLNQIAPPARSIWKKPKNHPYLL